MTAAAQAANGDILAGVRSRGYVTCGFRPAPGFAYSDNTGRLTGFMVDFCHGLAAAVLGDAKAIRTERLPEKPNEFAAVENHEVDVAFQTTSWTFSREISHNIQFTVPVFYDGQAFAVSSDQPPGPLNELKDATVCVKSATTTQRNLEDFILQNQRHWTVRLFKSYDETLQAFIGAECNMMTTDSSALVTSLAKYRRPGDNIYIDPKLISHEPLTPYVPEDDDNWADIVRSLIYATFLAEENDITASNVAAVRDNGSDEMRHMLGKTPGLGSRLGVRDDWAFQVISQVGNYGEIFERNLGSSSPFHMERGANRPWNHNGLLYAPQFQ